MGGGGGRPDPSEARRRVAEEEAARRRQSDEVAAAMERSRRRRQDEEARYERRRQEESTRGGSGGSAGYQRFQRQLSGGPEEARDARPAPGSGRQGMVRDGRYGGDDVRFSQRQDGRDGRGTTPPDRARLQNNMVSGR